MSSEDSWVFDSLVCFLHGPAWNAPLFNFIDEKSIVFDPNQQIDENNSEIQKIYNEYKNLVDCMLGSYLDEMQITPEQFELVCMERRQQQDENPFSLNQGLFQQIWAANDIKIFVRMMTQRNVELQLQALDLIERNQSIMQKESKLVNENSNSKKSDEEVLTEAADTTSVSESIDDTVKDIPSMETEVTDKFQRLNLFFVESPKVTPEDVQSRQEYLRQQRDKILEIKKRTRARQLLEMVTSDKNVMNEEVSELTRASAMRRPSSAQLAQHLMENNELVKIHDRETDTNAALQLRKTLAKRLKTEVVEQQK